MAINFDNIEWDEDINFSEIDWDEDDFDDDLTQEEIAEIERNRQDARMGFVYEMLVGEDGGFSFKCGKCGRVADIHEKPFPHKYGCPMMEKGTQED